MRVLVPTLFSPIKFIRSRMLNTPSVFPPYELTDAVGVEMLDRGLNSLAVVETTVSAYAASLRLPPRGTMSY